MLTVRWEIRLLFLPSDYDLVVPCGCVLFLKAANIIWLCGAEVWCRIQPRIFYSFIARVICCLEHVFRMYANGILCVRS